MISFVPFFLSSQNQQPVSFVASSISFYHSSSGRVACGSCVLLYLFNFDFPLYGWDAVYDFFFTQDFRNIFTLVFSLRGAYVMAEKCILRGAHPFLMIFLLRLQSETAVPMTGSSLGRNPVAAPSVAYI